MAINAKFIFRKTEALDKNLPLSYSRPLLTRNRRTQYESSNVLGKLARSPDRAT
jgi:hypothetical protein